MGVVWWAANAVTREATLEENVEVQLDSGLWTLLAEEWQYPDQGDRSPAVEVDHAQVRPRHPGRLVLWVSLAALVLFALGQRTIGGEGEHARTAFWCMSLYVLFALLLLALTNLSALRGARRRGISLAPRSPRHGLCRLFTVVASQVGDDHAAPVHDGGATAYVPPTWLQRANVGDGGGPRRAPGARASVRWRGAVPPQGRVWREKKAPAARAEARRRADRPCGERRVSAGRRMANRWGQQSEPAQPRLEPPTAGLGWLLLALIIAPVLVACISCGASAALLADCGLARYQGHRWRCWRCCAIAAWLGRLGLLTSWRGAVNSGCPFVDIFARGLDAHCPRRASANKSRLVYAARGDAGGATIDGA